MMEAMQITVSSAIANRIEDNNSTAERNSWDEVLTRKPWVETDMDRGKQSK
jgi:hypothetical protein